MIRNDNARLIRLQQSRRRQLYAPNDATTVEHGDVFADTKWLGEDDREPGKDVAQKSRNSDADTNTRDRSTRDQRRHLDTNRFQRDDKRDT